MPNESLPNEPMLKGKCECGVVSLQVKGEIEEFSHCHCSQCRRLHGSAFATFAAVAQAGFSYLSGQDKVSSYASSDHVTRHFCSNCSSMIMSEDVQDKEVFYLSMSILQGAPEHPEGYHEFVSSKASGHEILDDLPQHPKSLS